MADSRMGNCSGVKLFRESIMSKVKLYILKTSYEEIVPILHTAIDKLCEYRRSKVEKLKLEKPKAEMLATGLLWQHALSESGFGQSLDSVVLGENGKPFVQGIEFNISNKEEMVVVAISDTEVGVDVESKSDNGLRITKRFYTKEEQDYVLSGLTFEEACEKETEEMMKRFRTVWTMKEAYIKLTGTGMKVPVSKVATSPDTLTARVEDKVAYYKLLSYRTHEIAVAQYERLDEIEINEVSLANIL